MKTKPKILNSLKILGLKVIFLKQLEFTHIGIVLTFLTNTIFGGSHGN